MITKDLVLSIEQIQHLKKLDIELKDTAFVWYKRPYMDGYELRINYHRNNFHYDYIPTLTLQEILELLPKEIECDDKKFYLYINYQDGEVSYSISDVDMFFSLMYEDFKPNILQAAYNMLCWCAGNGYLNNSKNENN